MFIALTALTSFARRGDFGFLTPLSSAPEEHDVYSPYRSYQLCPQG